MSNKSEKPTTGQAVELLLQQQEQVTRQLANLQQWLALTQQARTIQQELDDLQATQARLEESEASLVARLADLERQLQDEEDIDLDTARADAERQLRAFLDQVAHPENEWDGPAHLPDEASLSTVVPDAGDGDRKGEAPIAPPFPVAAPDSEADQARPPSPPDWMMAAAVPPPAVQAGPLDSAPQQDVATVAVAPNGPSKERTRLCPHCAEPVPVSAQFCGNCGANVGNGRKRRFPFFSQG